MMDLTISAKFDERELLEQIGPTKAADFFGEEILREFSKREMLDFCGKEEAMLYFGLIEEGAE